MKYEELKKENESLMKSNKDLTNDLEHKKKNLVAIGAAMNKFTDQIKNQSEEINANKLLIQERNVQLTTAKQTIFSLSEREEITDTCTHVAALWLRSHRLLQANIEDIPMHGEHVGDDAEAQQRAHVSIISSR